MNSRDESNTFKEPSDLKSILRQSNKSLPVLFFYGVEAFFLILFVRLFGWLAYDTKYLKGKHFAHFWSQGWRWTFNGMISKLFTAHGRGIPWPISSKCTCGPNIEFDTEDIGLFQSGSYFQTLGGGKIHIGKGCWIANGCALITSNHDVYNPDLHTSAKDIFIGNSCWLGSNVVITPGVKLGSHTVVGANAVVTKSFPEGNCVIGGVPAKLIRKL